MKMLWEKESGWYWIDSQGGMDISLPVAVR